MTGLRDYQQELYIKARNALKTKKSICIQSATGSGKTAIMASMCDSVYGKNKRAWIIVPRNELLNQASEHLRRWNVPHGIISANSQESRAYKIHIVSKNTLIRRFDKIKNFPDLLILDEAHIATLRHKEIIEYLPETSKIIGYTATPERLSGEGLSIQGGGIYDELIEGPSIPWLTERNFLCQLRYFSPPLEGLEKLHVRGYDYDEEELEELLERKKIYGQVIDHYIKYGKNKAALIFCRSVKSAYQTAERFRDRGFNFHTVEGKMTAKKIKELLDAHRNGTIQGLTTADLVLYGVDIPRVEYGASLRPTLSRSLYMQMIGRILRPFKDDKTGYIKEEAIWMDHVNMVLEHQDSDYPGIPLHYVPHINWNFHGTEKRKKKKNENNIRLCPLMNFLYCDKPSCRGCPHNPDQQMPDQRKPMLVVPAELKEIKPIPLNERPIHERREIQDRIGKAVMDYKLNMSPGAVGELLKIADQLKYKELWVYWKLTEENRYTINLPLLYEIARQKNYKPGWVYFIKKQITYSKKIKNEYQEVMN